MSHPRQPSRVAGPGPATAATPDEDEELCDEELSDDELTTLALAADPSTPLADDAVPLDLYSGGLDLLPLWYMPPVVRHRSKRWHRWAIVAVIVAFLTIDLFGLCDTYGLLSAA